MIVYLAMIFTVLEILSTIFNQYFYNINFYGINFPLNISVVFFCLAFFVLDITTEVYNNKEADKLIYGKLLCQITFLILGWVGILGANLQHSQLDNIISTTPNMMFSGMTASLIGYKITTYIMQKMKLVYRGQLLPLRYICSSLPGEITFSLIFSILSFSHGRSLNEFLMVFLTLTMVKIILSLLFSFIVIPITIAIKYFAELPFDRIEYVPFT